MPATRLVRLFVLVAAVAVPAAAGMAYVHADRAAPQARMALTRGSTLVLANADGSSSRAILATKRSDHYSYPWYSWSPDGQYLLAVRLSQPQSARWDLLILNADGTVIRTIRDAQPSSGFYPNWAIDADQVAYLAAGKPGNQRAVVRWASPSGQAGVLFTYTQQQGGCGGGVADPASIVYAAQTGDAGMMVPIQWSVKQHLAIRWIGGSDAVVDTRLGTIRRIGTAHHMVGDTVLSTQGGLAGTRQNCGPRGCSSSIVLVDPATLRVSRQLGQGELPVWSRDGKALYFVRRTPGKVLTWKDRLGNAIQSTTYTSSIWRAAADGSARTELLKANAYGFGFLNVSEDGRTLTFSRVENATRLSHHLLPGRRATPSLLARYGPRVDVQRLTVGGSAVTVATGSGLPSVQS